MHTSPKSMHIVNLLELCRQNYEGIANTIGVGASKKTVHANSDTHCTCPDLTDHQCIADSISYASRMQEHYKRR